MNHEVSEKLLKRLLVISDYTDFRRIPDILQRVTNLCNRYLIFLIRELYIFLGISSFLVNKRKRNDSILNSTTRPGRRQNISIEIYLDFSPIF
jgi:hypothetical protein